MRQPCWDALLNNDEQSLDTYNLFNDNSNPRHSPNDSGIPYNLNTPLFTDYTNKYRFAFIPCGEQAVFSDNDAFSFPIGTALVKTFAIIPTDINTEKPDIKNKEQLLETRLLIHRPNGWEALTYAWDESSQSAQLTTAGETITTNITHKGENIEVNYEIPRTEDCMKCHYYNNDISPLGPKARNLNKNYYYLNSGSENQLVYWSNSELLSDIPDINQIDKKPDFTNDTDISQLSTDQLEDNAKAYLDSQCSSCHGVNTYYNKKPYYEYWREIDTSNDDDNHGIGSVIVAGDSANSTLNYYFSIGYMPYIGTSVVHREGEELLDSWVDSMPPQDSINNK